MLDFVYTIFRFRSRTVIFASLVIALAVDLLLLLYSGLTSFLPLNTREVAILTPLPILAIFVIFAYRAMRQQQNEFSFLNKNTGQSLEFENIYSGIQHRLGGLSQSSDQSSDISYVCQGFKRYPEFYGALLEKGAWAKDFESLPLELRTRLIGALYGQLNGNLTEFADNLRLARGQEEVLPPKRSILVRGIAPTQESLAGWLRAYASRYLLDAVALVSSTFAKNTNLKEIQAEINSLSEALVKGDWSPSDSSRFRELGSVMPQLVSSRRATGDYDVLFWFSWLAIGLRIHETLSAQEAETLRFDDSLRTIVQLVNDILTKAENSLTPTLSTDFRIYAQSGERSLDHMNTLRHMDETMKLLEPRINTLGSELKDEVQRLSIGGRFEHTTIHAALYYKQARSMAGDAGDSKALVDLQSNYSRESEKILKVLADRRVSSIFSVRPLDPRFEGKLFLRRGDMEKVEQILQVTDGGNFAILGVRGSGKSTLVRQVAFDQGDQNIVVQMSVPRKFEILDFLRSFLLQVCREVMRVDQVRRNIEELRRARDYDSSQFPRTTIDLRNLSLSALAGLGSFLYLNILQSTIPSSPQDSLSRFVLSPVLPPAFGFLIGLAAYELLLWRKNRRRRLRRLEFGDFRRSLLGTSGERTRYDLARRTVEIHENLQYVEAFSLGETSGSEAGLQAAGISIGVSEGKSREYSKTKRDYTLPLIYYEIRSYFEDVIALLKKDIIVIFDDLDKMDDTEAEDFLKELRTVFSVKGCYYLIVGPTSFLSTLQAGMLQAEGKREPDTVIDDVVILQGMNDEDMQTLIEKRLDLREIRDVFPDAAINAIVRVSQGNPRNAIRILNSVFRKWLGSFENTVTTKLVVDSYAEKMRFLVKSTSDCKTLVNIIDQFLTLIDGWGAVSKAEPCVAVVNDGLSRIPELFGTDVASGLASRVILRELKDGDIESGPHFLKSMGQKGLDAGQVWKGLEHLKGLGLLTIALNGGYSLTQVGRRLTEVLT